MGICGTGMASLAGMLKEKGYLITGSDANVYPPMDRFLEGLSIPIMEGYDPNNLDPDPDLVIVGNVITRDNPEAVELSRRKLHYLSFPQALCQFALKGKKSIVISGTHGKTTTSSLTAWILERAGMDPGFMIGGIPKNFLKNFKLGHGRYFVVEGDEYDTAFFDKGPKFLHYAPYIAILTNIEFDHADIYRDIDHVVKNFRMLIDILPEDGILIANLDDDIIAGEIKRAQCRVITYALSGNADWRAEEISVEKNHTGVRITKKGKDYARLSTPLYGHHNISNLLSTVILADILEVSLPDLSDAAQTFEGIKRRQEIVGEKRGILILDDFAHHPTAVGKTIKAVKEKYADRRLIAVFEPRSNSSRRNVFQKEYASSFDHADLVMIPEPPMMEKIPRPERFSSHRLVSDLKARGIDSFYFQNTDDLLETLLKETRAGDVVLIMSNGAFDNIQQRFFESM